MRLNVKMMPKTVDIFASCASIFSAIYAIYRMDRNQSWDGKQADASAAAQVSIKKMMQDIKRKKSFVKTSSNDSGGCGGVGSGTCAPCQHMASWYIYIWKGWDGVFICKMHKALYSFQQ